MKPIRTLFLLSSVVALGLANAHDELVRAKLDAAAIYERAMPAIALIYVVNTDGTVGQGSGVNLQASGLVVTNAHVVKRARAALLKFRSGIIYQGIEIVSFNEQRDLALLKFEGKDLPFLEVSSSSAIRVGTTVYAIGAPRGFEGTISPGIVSALRGADFGLASGLPPDFVQFTAPVSPGSSGGPLVDEFSSVVGIVMATHTGAQNLNLAVPGAHLSAMLAGGHVLQQRLENLDEVDFAARLESAKKPDLRPAPEILSSAKTICVHLPKGGNPTIKAKIGERINQWGKLRMVSAPEGADLVLEVTQVGEYTMKDHLGSYSSATAVLKVPGSDAELWVISKGSYWSLSGFSIAKVSAQIGDSFVKFFDATLKKQAVSKTAPKAKR